jgi:hypothetical protein
MMYAWEPSADTKYVYSVHPEYTPGHFYDVLQVEQSNEGWHGFLLMYSPPSHYEDEYDSGGLGIFDEELFNTRDQAVLWCEQRDTARINKEQSNDEHDGEYNGEYDSTCC